MALAELAEPQVLQRDGEHHLEADDGENRAGDITEIAIEPVQEDNPGLVVAIPQERADERKRGEEDDEDIAGQKHPMPPRETDPPVPAGSVLLLSPHRLRR